jgi:hypothetical protein
MQKSKEALEFFKKRIADKQKKVEQHKITPATNPRKKKKKPNDDDDDDDDDDDERVNIHVPPPPPEPVTTPQKISIPDVMKHGQPIQYDRFALIQQNYAAMNDDNVAYTSNGHIASNLFEYDVKPVMLKLMATSSNDDDDEDEAPKLDPVRVRTVDPRSFQTVTHMIEATNNDRRGGGTSTDNTGTELANLTVIPVCSRAWEESYLYSPTGVERACGFGDECLCLAKYGFRMKEFLTQMEHLEVQRDGVQKSIVKPCLYDIRDSCLKSYVYCVTNNKKFSERYLMQPHRNLVGVEGEYDIRDALPLANDYLYPLMMNISGGYTRFHDRATDIYHLKQTGYRKPTTETQDFQSGALLLIK